ncbi:TGF-beta-activated kinase 1 and MAP3K7-binding protein 2-like [Tropilaelaps mercedesae]|uniref:TGF-beta-activated kinase 1 and MAP3K7-binding protein 2-like n=1 Tax=Tropilaelaps mercedesae TaxID=418985 RepID=A0A1V9XG51_9ACAR|nr:TGF-beta-activated kinase 1 and MAP3K7-binding protein 2-like [Tropilaelaps mercedesae]
MEGRENLLIEMLHRFPDLPVDTVRAYVDLYPRNRDALVRELTRSSLLSKAEGPNIAQSIEGGEALYSNFSNYEPSMGIALGSLPFPGPPPSLVITPPTSPEKTMNKFPGAALSDGDRNGDSSLHVPALSIARGVSAIHLGYEEFLLQNQRQRLKALEEAYKRNETCLAELRREVLAKERLLFEKTLFQSSSVSGNKNIVNITVNTLLELAQANRQLSIQNQCLVTEVDLQTDGRAPLGDVTRPSFYDQIYPGPRDPLVEIDSRTPSRNITVSAMANRRELGHNTMLMVNGDDDVDDTDHWACQACTLNNHPELPFCEACSSPKPMSQPGTSSVSRVSSISLSGIQQRLNSASLSNFSDPLDESSVTIIASANNTTTTIVGDQGHNNTSNSKFPRIVKEASSSSDSSLSLSDSSGSKGSTNSSSYGSENDENGDVQIEVTGTAGRGSIRSPICLRIRQRIPRDSITFRFYKNINRGLSSELTFRVMCAVL